MSGHSHWKTVKRTKDADAKRRSLLFSKASKAISLAVKEKGSNIETNPSLRIAIEKAKEVHMPKENIEKAIKKGTGETKEGQLESFLFEAYGPGGTAFLAEGITDNKNRSLSEFKQIINKFNGKVAEPGSVKWMFEEKGLLIIPFLKNNKESIELSIIEANADNYQEQDQEFYVTVKKESLEKSKTFFEEKNIEIRSFSLSWVPANPIKVSQESQEACQKIFDALDENEDIQEIYSNF